MSDDEIIESLRLAGDEHLPPRGWENKVRARIRLGQGLDVDEPKPAGSVFLAALAAASLMLVGFTAHRFLQDDNEVRRQAAESLFKIEEEIKMVQADIALYRREMQAAYRELEDARTEEARFRALARRKRAEIEEARAFAELSGLRKKSRESSTELVESKGD